MEKDKQKAPGEIRDHNHVMSFLGKAAPSQYAVPLIGLLHAL